MQQYCLWEHPDAMMFKLCFSALESDCEAALVDLPKCGAAKADKRAAKADKTKQLPQDTRSLADPCLYAQSSSCCSARFSRNCSSGQNRRFYVVWLRYLPVAAWLHDKLLGQTWHDAPRGTSSDGLFCINLS